MVVQTANKASQPSLKELLKWLTSITRPVHKPLYISTVFRILNLCLDIALFALAGAGVAAAITSRTALTSWLVALVLVALAKAGTRYAEQFTGHYVAFKALELLRTHVFATLWPKAPAIVAHSRSGDVLTSLTRDVDRIEVVYAHTFAPVISAYITPILALVVAGVCAGWDTVAIPAVCVAIGLFIVPFAGLRQAMKHTHRTLELRRAMAHHVSDSVFGAEEAVTYGREVERISEANALSDKVNASAVVPLRVAGLRRAANLTLALVSCIGAVYAGINGGHSLIATMAVAAGALRLFVGPVGVEDAAGYLDHSLAAARRLWDISHEPERVSDGPRILNLTEAPAVAFENVSYTYTARSEGEMAGADFALRDVNIEIPAGERTVLVGPSGSGKSTAVHMLLRYDDPSAGQVTIGGVPVTEFTLDSLRHGVVCVAQSNQLLNSSIGANVRLGVPDASDEEVWSALEAAGMAGEVRAMPAGLATSVGQDGSRLSGGQAQRLCLARAILMKPQVLVLDEFTAALNVELEKEIREQIAKCLAGVTIIEVTHRLESAEDADRVVLMDCGRVVAIGTPTEIRAASGSMIEFFRNR